MTCLNVLIKCIMLNKIGLKSELVKREDHLFLFWSSPFLVTNVCKTKEIISLLLILAHNFAHNSTFVTHNLPCSKCIIVN